MTEVIPLWLDCDTGHDDALAILLAAHHPSLHLLGISTVYGNAPLTHTTHNTIAILEAIQRQDVPVYAGASTPFCRNPASAADIHGESGLDGTTCLPTPSVTAKVDRIATEAMYQSLIAQPPGTAWLVATGCLTNIALLFALHPDLASHIAGLSIMGGAIGDNFSDAPMGRVRGEGERRFGNWTPWAEFNIYIDPESAQSVFANPILNRKIVLVPLDLTHQFLATDAVLRTFRYGPDSTTNPSALRHTEGSLVRRLFFEVLTFFAKTYADVFGLTDGPPTHDPLAVAAVFAPQLFHDNGGERYAVAVVTDGEHGSSVQARGGVSQCGRTVATLLASGEQGVRIPRSLEKQKLWMVIEECLGRAERAIKQ